MSISDNRHHVSLHPSLDCRPHAWKKAISDSFQTQILPNILPVARILSFTMMTYLKKLIRIKSLNTRQCPAGFSPRIIPSSPVSSLLPKDSKIERFRLIIAGSPPLFKGDGSWGSIFQNNKGVKFSSKKEEVIMSEQMLLIFVFVNPRSIAI